MKKRFYRINNDERFYLLATPLKTNELVSPGGKRIGPSMATTADDGSE